MSAEPGTACPPDGQRCGAPQPGWNGNSGVDPGACTFSEALQHLVNQHASELKELMDRCTLKLEVLRERYQGTLLPAPVEPPAVNHEAEVKTEDDAWRPSAQAEPFDPESNVPVTRYQSEAYDPESSIPMTRYQSEPYIPDPNITLTYPKRRLSEEVHAQISETTRARRRSRVSASIESFRFTSGTTSEAGGEKLTEAFAQHERTMRKSATVQQKDLQNDPVLSAAAVSRQFQDRPALIARIVQGMLFRTLSAVLILSSAALMGCQVEFAAATQTSMDTLPMAFNIAHNVYCVLFLVELILRLVAEGSSFFCGEERWWNLLDFGVVGVSTIEMLVDVVYGAENKLEAEQLQSLTIVRLVRVFRTLRLIRIIRVITFFKSLRILVRSIFSTLRSLGWALVFLLVIMYMFGVAFAQGAIEHLHQTDDQDPRLLALYGSLPRSIYTLFQAMTSGVNWAIAMAPLRQLHWFYEALFVMFISFVQFAVMNVVTGVFCQSAIESVSKDQDEVLAEQLSQRENWIQRLTECFQDMDRFGTGKITLTEFEQCLSTGMLGPFLAMLDVRTSDAWEVFKLLDLGGKHAIYPEEFISGCLRLQGQAKIIDIEKMNYEVRWMLDKMCESISKMEQIMGNSPGHGVSPGSSEKACGSTNCVPAHPVDELPAGFRI